MRTVGGARLRDEFAVPRQARQMMPRGDARQRRRQSRGQRARAAHIDVKAGIGRRHLDIERLLRRRQGFGDRPGGFQRAVEALGQDRAAVDGNDVMRAHRRKADREHVMRAAPRVENRAPAAVAVSVDEIGDRRVDAGLTQCGRDQIALPGAVRSGLPVLQGAAAANAEMRADRRDALRARCFDGEELSPVGMAGQVLDFDASRPAACRHVDRAVGAVGDAVAAMADACRSASVLNHVRPR